MNRERKALPVFFMNNPALHRSPSRHYVHAQVTVLQRGSGPRSAHDGMRHETVHGELLVTSAPGGPHQFVLKRLRYALSNYLVENGIEEAPHAVCL